MGGKLGSGSLVDQPRAGSEQTSWGEESLSLSLLVNFVLFLLYVMQLEVKSLNLAVSGPGPCPLNPSSALLGAVTESQAFLLDTRLGASPA